jgi:hypothetical protein
MRTRTPGLLAGVLLTGPLLILQGACASIGPSTITRDRFDYSTRIAESWKEQTLLNIVKLRYVDLPIFLDVGQIVSGYTVESAGTLGVSATRGDVLHSEGGTLGGSYRFTDRPTITYTPLTGDRFLRGMLGPLQPVNVFALLQSGYAADFVLGLSVDSLQGLRNPTSQIALQADVGGGFWRAVKLLREIQLANALNFRLDSDAKTGTSVIVFFRADDLPAQVIAAIEELRTLLRLTPGAREFRLVTSPVAGGPGELAMQTRSMLQILLALAATVEVPPQHAEEGRAVPVMSQSAQESLPLLVRSARERPADVYAAVPYRDHWYWIEDRDLRSKRAFAFIMFLFTLSDAGTQERLPVLTIPTS